MIRLFTYRYWHPIYRNHVTLDCPAATVEDALASAQRFLRRENNRFRRAGLKCRAQAPYHPSWMKLDPSCQPIPATVHRG